MTNVWSLGVVADLYSGGCDKATPLSSATRSTALNLWIIISPRGWGRWFSLAAVPRQNIRGQLCTSFAIGSVRFVHLLLSVGGICVESTIYLLQTAMQRTLAFIPHRACAHCYLGAHRLSACSSPFPTWILGALLSVRLFCTELLLLTLTMAWAIMHIVLLDLSLSTNSTVSSQKISFPFPDFKLTCSHELPRFGWLYLAPLSSGNTLCLITGFFHDDVTPIQGKWSPWLRDMTLQYKIAGLFWCSVNISTTISTADKGLCLFLYNIHI